MKIGSKRLMELDEIRTYINVDRKQYLPEDCCSTDLKDVPQHIKDMLKTLPTVDTSLIMEYDEEDNESPIDPNEFSLFHDYFGSEQFWVLKHKGRNYFVDTQGYDYARYCGGIFGEF